MTPQPAATATPARSGVAAARARHGAAFRLLMAGLVAAAWLALWLWSASPYARYLEHGRWGDGGALAALCRALPQGDIVVPALLYAGGWMLMIAAMMLPTTFPIVEMFRRMTASRADRGRLVALLLGGYVAAWLGFGLLAHGTDALVHALAAAAPRLAFNDWAVGAAILLTAGLFQFSSLKYRCLEKCRMPLGFINERWRGRHPARDALKIGIDHGLFCIGCCWALMLLMFVVGTGSLGWMLALAAIMAVEKNLPGGQRLSAPLGIALVAWALGIVAVHTVLVGA
jgi:predicted metal-binding membrane protein